MPILKILFPSTNDYAGQHTRTRRYGGVFCLILRDNSGIGFAFFYESICGVTVNGKLELLQLVRLGERMLDRLISKGVFPPV